MTLLRGRGRNRTAVIGLMLALGLALAGVSVADAARVPFRHCGTLPGPGARFSILVHDGRCGTARHVIAGLFAGEGRRRRDPKTGQIEKVIDGWICGSAAGGFSCGKLGPHGTIRPVNLRHLGPIINAEGL
jgi:hypothetical protein